MDPRDRTADVQSDRKLNDLKEIIMYFWSSLKPIMELKKKQSKYYISMLERLINKYIPLTLDKAIKTVLRGRRALPGLVLALAGLATLAFESFSSYLQSKRSKAMADGLKAINKLHRAQMNKLNELEDDFIMYGEYSEETVDKTSGTLKSEQNRTVQIEEVLA